MLMSQSAAGEALDKNNHTEGNGSVPFEEVSFSILFCYILYILSCLGKLLNRTVSVIKANSYCNEWLCLFSFSKCTM